MPVGFNTAQMMSLTTRAGATVTKSTVLNYCYEFACSQLATIITEMICRSRRCSYIEASEYSSCEVALSGAMSLVVLLKLPMLF